MGGAGDYCDQVIDSFTGRGLYNSPPEIWFVYLLVVLDSFCYFGMSYILVLYLSSDFGYSDQEAGWAYGVMGMVTSVCGIAFGCTVDVLGVKRTLLLGHVLLFISRALMTFTTDRLVLQLSLLLLKPLGGAFVGPAMSTGLRRFTNDSNRSLAFSFYVVVMNLGGLFAAPTVDIIRTTFEGMSAGNPDVLTNEYRLIMLATTIVTVFSTLMILFMRDVDVSEDGEVREIQTNKENPFKIMASIFGTSRFWRFMLFIVLLMGVRFVFRHLDATFPKYMVRTFGPDVPFATILAINPFLVIFLVPLFTPIANYFSLYNIILVGTSITTMSVLFMLLDPQQFYPSILFVAVLSIGEALWSPRLFEYSCMIAPKGREGTFMACANAPMFLAKLAVGGLSGWLLTEYCPETATPENERCDGRSLWLMVFLMTLSSPLLMLLLKPFIDSEGKNLKDENTDEGEESAFLSKDE